MRRHPPRAVFLVGIGMGNPDTLTIQAQKTIESCQLLIGAKRMIAPFSALGIPTFCSFLPEEIAAYLNDHPEVSRAAVLFSGDVGFYSGARALLEQLRALPNLHTETICGISAPVYFCAKLHIPWENMPLLSVHGRDANWLAAVATHPRTFLLTGGEHTVAALCQTLCEHGLGAATVHVGERLSYPDERLVSARAADLTDAAFDPLSVLVVEHNAPRRPVTHGLPDGAFQRGNVPMTKSEVRSVCLSKLRLFDGDITYDIGAGTGSVSVEMALQIPNGTVYAIERNPDAISLIHENKKRFLLQNLNIIEGTAPQAMDTLPTPDCVFLGGTGSYMLEILSMLMQKNPRVRVVLTAITLETLHEALGALQTLKFLNISISQLTVARAEVVGKYHMMRGQNPIFILSAGGSPEGLA